MFIFSIGLNVGGKEPADMVNRVFRALSIHGEIRKAAFGASEWQGVPERFVQVLVETYSPDGRAVARKIATYLEQDAVAAMRTNTPGDNGAWLLVYADAQKPDEYSSAADYPVILGDY